MKKLLSLFAFVLIGLSVYAQPGSITSPEESDPKAKAVLEQIRQRFMSYSSLGMDFTLDITFPEEPTEKQKGSIAQQGDKYRVELGTQSVISDGKALWMIMHFNKEVQINDIPDDDDGGSILSPESLLTFYDQGDFIYYLTNEYKSGGKVIQQIEFKPVDRSLDYSKLRMNVYKDTKDIASVEAFARDGSRYKVTIDKLVPNKTFSSGHFTFNKSDYPDYYVEDLRE
ncbi:MAG: outer membrane lipoprotein carrier protein LolA [Chitinophagales bacterium]|nr:outer membrane lipoprotein carrier protein LolA [Chitinophagales bacterium]